MIEHYIILRGIERFYTEYYTYPGEIDEQVEPDIPKLKVINTKTKLHIFIIKIIIFDLTFSHAYQNY